MSISQIATIAIENRTGVLADSVSENIPLLIRLKSKDKIKPVTGGYKILQEIEYAENPSYKRYTADEPLNITRGDFALSAEFEWKQAAVAVSMTGLEEIQTSGKEGVIDYLEAKIKNADKTMYNNMDEDIQSDGTADGGKQVGGTSLLVAETPTNTVGGIDASLAANAWWRNLSVSASTDLGIPSLNSATIQTAMANVFVRLKRNGDKVDLIIADNNLWLMYLQSLTPGTRVGADKTFMEKGVDALNFMGADVICGGGKGGHAPANQMRFLNTDYIFFRPSSKRNFVPLGGERVPVNQDSMVKFIAWAGNMTISNRSMQGFLKP